jgi:choline dehydrogenase
LQIQHDLLFKHNVTAAEVLTAIAGGGILASNYWALFPFSRGSVHLGSLEKLNEPLVDPRIFLADFDLSTMVAAGKFTERFWFSEPMKTQAEMKEPDPSEGFALARNASDAEWHVYLRDTGEHRHPPHTTRYLTSR